MKFVVRDDFPVSRLAAPLMDPFRVFDAAMKSASKPQSRSAASSAETPTFSPQFDVLETKDAFELWADLPGVAESQLDISLNGNVLTVSGRKGTATHEADGENAESDSCEPMRVFVRERACGAFSRAFRVPDTIDPDAVTAELKDGVLKLRLGKRAETQPRKIAVNAAA